jgi:hypothetical protein
MFAMKVKLELPNRPALHIHKPSLDMWRNVSTRHSYRSDAWFSRESANCNRQSWTRHRLNCAFKLMSPKNTALLELWAKLRQVWMPKVCRYILRLQDTKWSQIPSELQNWPQRCISGPGKPNLAQIVANNNLWLHYMIFCIKVNTTWRRVIQSRGMKWRGREMLQIRERLTL